MENEAVKKSAEQVTVSNANNEVMKKAFANMVQGFTSVAAVVATEAIRTVANLTILGIAKTAELVNKIFDDPKDAKQKSEFISKLKGNPKKFLEYIENVEEKLYENLEKLQQKLIEIKKSIAKISLALNKANRKYHLLSNRMDALGKELEKVRNKIKELEKQPGQEKNVEILKIREKEILNKLEELNRRRLEELNRIKELEEQKKKLEAEKDSIEKDKEKCQDKVEKINSLEHEYKQTFGIETQNKETPLEKYERYRQIIKMREENPTQTSNDNWEFAATYNSKDQSFDNPVIKNLYSDETWLKKKVRYAKDTSDLLNKKYSEQNHEHGGKDEKGGR